MLYTYNHTPQINVISKVYSPLFLTKIQNLLRDPDADPTEIKEIYEDAIDIIEKYINKNVSYTLLEYIFQNVSGSELLVDEGHFHSISAITSTDANNNITTITGYTIWFDSNHFFIRFSNSINAKELKIAFYTGFPLDTLPKGLRRVLYILINDLYDNERSSYSIGNTKESKVIERNLNPFCKSFFHKYNQNHYNIMNIIP